MPKRQLRQAEGEEQKESFEQQDVEAKRTRILEKRWLIPQHPELSPLPPPHSDINEDLLQNFLGFPQFSSTKGLHVFANQDGPVPPRRKKRQYRQMLHIRGIYDIPLTKDQLEQRQ